MRQWYRGCAPDGKGACAPIRNLSAFELQGAVWPPFGLNIRKAMKTKNAPQSGGVFLRRARNAVNCGKAAHGLDFIANILVV